MPACLLSHPNSLMLSSAPKTFWFRSRYSRYTRCRVALCSHAAAQSNSSCDVIRANSSGVIRVYRSYEGVFAK